MSDFMGDLSSFVPTNATGNLLKNSKVQVATKSNDSLSMTDFLTLMVAQFQNQSIDNTMDTNDMLNQMVQMTVVQAIQNITDASVMMYAGSLVGQEVTIGQFDNKGVLQEIVGKVTGTGVSGGQQVVFVDGKSYYLSDIMAIGRLPELDKGDNETENPDGKPTDPDAKPNPDPTPDPDPKPDPDPTDPE